MDGNDTFDIDAFVHTSSEGFGNDRPPATDGGSIDVAALGSLAPGTQAKGRKLTRKERKAAKREMRERAKEAKQAEREAKQKYTSVKSQLRDR